MKAINKRWIREGPGIPSKGIFADNGGEFKNPKIRLTAAHSPWSNGKNLDKLLEEDPKLALEEAVSHAVNAKNMQITRRGFSPRQLMLSYKLI